MSRIIAFFRWTIRDEYIREEESLTFGKSVVFLVTLYMVVWVTAAFASATGHSLLFWMLTWVDVMILPPLLGSWSYYLEEEYRTE